MRRSAIALLTLLLMPLAVHAQVADVNLKDAFAVHPDSLAKAEALGAALDRNTFQALTRSPYADSTIRFTAVLLSDPLNSGLASATNGAAPNRVHVFVRDTAAVSDPAGMAGYGAQVVDGNYQTSGLLNLAPGAVITVTGTIAYFSGVPQVSPTSVDVVTTDYRTIGLPDAILDPISLSIADLNGEGVAATNTTNAQSTINFANYGKYAQEYVEISNATVVSSSEGTGSRAGRFNIYFQQGDRTLAFTDVSLRYRNDHIGNTGYIGLGFNVRTEPYVPPSVGARVNLRGFTIYGDFDGENYFNPNMQLILAPFEDGDIEVLPGAPPSVTNASRPATLVTGDADVVITAGVEAGQERTLAKAELYVMVDGGVATVYPMTNTSGTEYSGSIPASILNDGNFVQYFVRATDNVNDVTDSPHETIRVVGKVDTIAEIQMTEDGGPGRSPLNGVTIDAASGLMDLVVTMQTDADSSGLFTAQDGTDPWSGIFLGSSNELRALAPGAQIRITGARIREDFDVTQLEDLTFEVVSATGTPFPYVETTTTALVSPSAAEAHEGMLVRFNNVEITSSNPDAPSGPFGEWAFKTVGTSDAVRADDRSSQIPSSFAATLNVGAKYDFIQGVWYFSFGNYKLLPQFTSDLAIATAIGDGELPEGFGLGRTYPNPARTSAAIPFSLGRAGFVTLDVYDTLGRRVARVLAEDRPAGAQAVTFSTETLGAGLYLVRLTAGQDQQTQPLVVVR